MQLLLGMLDAALGASRTAAPRARGAVALKIDEAPLVINAAFAQTLALKRSAGPRDRRLLADRRPVGARTARAARRALRAPRALRHRVGGRRAGRLGAADVRILRSAARRRRASSRGSPRRTSACTFRATPRSRAGRRRAGRERPFIATTIPLPLDRDRIDWHAREQTRRGGRELPEPRASRAALRDCAGAVTPAHRAGAGRLRRRPARSSPPLRTLSFWRMDGARRVRWLPVPQRAGARRRSIRPTSPSWRSSRAHAVPRRTQVNRACHAGRSLTTTQRALKRLADAGLIARFQLHRDDGGGVPLCVVVTTDAIEALGVSGRRAPELGDRELERLRGDVHTTGWLLALEEPPARRSARCSGPGAPRSRRPTERDRRRCSSPRAASARLPRHRGGRRSRARERFAPLRPHAVVEFAGAHRPARLLGRARRPRRRSSGRIICSPDGGARSSATAAAAARRSSWWCATRTRRALEVAALADRLLSAALARIGRAPGRWERPGRAGVRIAAEGDLHRGDFGAWAVPPLPPALRDGAPPAPSRVEIVPLGARVARTA